MIRGLLALILGGIVVLSGPKGVDERVIEEQRVQTTFESVTPRTKTVIEPVYRVRVEPAEGYGVDLVDLISGEGNKIELEKVLDNVGDYNFVVESYSENVCTPLGKLEYAKWYGVNPIDFLYGKVDWRELEKKIEGDIEDYKILFVKPEREVVAPPRTKELEIRPEVNPSSGEVYQTLPVYVKELDDGSTEYKAVHPGGREEIEIISNE